MLLPKRWYIFSYIVPFVAFGVSAWAAPQTGFIPPAELPLDSAAYFAHQLRLSIWAIGLLLSVVGFLLVGVLWFIKKIYDTNIADHTHLAEVNKQQWELIGAITKQLSHLSGEHDAAFQLRGCAYEPERFKKALEEILRQVLVGEEDQKNCRFYRRITDRPPYTDIGAPHGASD